MAAVKRRAGRKPRPVDRRRGVRSHRRPPRVVVQSCFALSKNIRDVHEASRMINRIEEARTEKLLSSERS